MFCYNNQCLSDNGGIREAYKAYHKYLAKKALAMKVDNYIEPGLPGLSQYTDDQV